MSKIHMRYLKHESDKYHMPADEYTVSITRSDGLPLTEVEVGIVLAQGIYPQRLVMDDAGARDDVEENGATADDDLLAGPRMPVQVTNMNAAVLDPILRKLDQSEHLVWLSALQQLIPHEGPQVVTLRDLKAAMRLVAEGLLEIHIHSGKTVARQYVVPKTLAFSSVELHEESGDGPIVPTGTAYRRRGGMKNLSWIDLLDEVERSLSDTLPASQAIHLANIADVHEDWLSTSSSGRLFDAKDHKRMVNWLLDRKDEAGFRFPLPVPGNP